MEKTEENKTTKFIGYYEQTNIQNKEEFDPDLDDFVHYETTERNIIILNCYTIKQAIEYEGRDGDDSGSWGLILDILTDNKGKILFKRSDYKTYTEVKEALLRLLR